jgi:hypothetical protein
MKGARRKPASPVCYADEPGIDPAYMWAETPAKARRPTRPVYPKRRAAYSAPAAKAKRRNDEGE